MSKRKAILRELTSAAKRGSELAQKQDIPEKQKEWVKHSFETMTMLFETCSTQELEMFLSWLKTHNVKNFNPGQVLRDFTN